MANKVLPKFKAASVSGGANVNLLTGNVKVIMVDEGAYTYSDTHEFLSDLPSAARISTSGNLGSKAVTAGGAFQSGNGRCDGVSGASVEAIAIVVDTGADATSRIVAYYNSGVTGLPVTPAGASYNIIPDSTGWFVL